MLASTSLLSLHNNQTLNIVDIIKGNKTNDNRERNLGNDSSNTFSTRTKKKSKRTKSTSEPSDEENHTDKDRSPGKNSDKDTDEYYKHSLPLIVGDTVHVLEENGEGVYFHLISQNRLHKICLEQKGEYG